MSLIEKALKQAERERRRKDIYWEILTLAFSPSSQKKSSRIFFFLFFLPFLAIITYFSYMVWKYPPEPLKPLSLKSMTIRSQPLSPSHLANKEEPNTLMQKAQSSSGEKIQQQLTSQTERVTIAKKGSAQHGVHEMWEDYHVQQASVPPPQQPNLARLHFERGKELLSQENYLGAKEEFNASLALSPFNPEAHNNLGIIFQKEGDLLKAEEELLNALEQNPSSEKILNNLGLNSYLREQWDKAILYYQAALRVNPQNLATYTNLSLLYKKLNNQEKAKDILEQALSLNPGHPESLYNLAVLLEGMGEKEKAELYYQRFINFSGPAYQGLVEKVRTHLKELHQ